ncbi:hypothetical protein OROGR_020279 [Orobanche gracilis]
MESKDFSAKRLQRKIIVDQKRRRTGNKDRPPFTPIENDSRIPGVIRPMHLTQQARGNMFDPGKENFKPMSSSCVTQSTTTPGVKLNNLNIWNKFTNTFGVCSALTYQRTAGTVNPRPSINVANPLDTEHVPTRRGKHIIQSSTVLQFVQQNLHTDNCLTNINPQLRYMRSTSKTTEHATISHSTISMGDCGSFFSPFQSSIPVEDSNTHSQYCHGESSSRQVVNEDIGSDNKHGDDIDDENDNHIQGEYWDIGDPEFECQYCGAQMWYGERLKKARRQKNPKFGLCCGQGKGVDNDFDPTLVNALKNMIDVYNPIAQSFRMAADRIQQGDCSNVKLRLIGRRSKDGRQYNLPTSSEVAAIIIGDINPDYDQRDIYPMLFTYGEDGFRNDVPHAMGNSKKKKNVTIREHLAYRIQDRAEESPTILLGRRLFHQFLVDTCTTMETQRLCFIRNNQKLVRADKYKNITDAKRKGKTNTSSIGKKFVLPSSHTGSWRWVVQNCQDAMAISRWTGFPDLIITFTCNPKWPEILRFCKKKGVKSEDRPDILCRVFKMKLDEMIKDLKERKMFGKPSAIVYTVEFQKRGLPHAHILLFLASDSKFHTAEDIDRVISAEIPDKESRPELYKAVSDYMVHGPCGASNPNSPCMLEKKKCSKMFPKRFSERTIFDEDGYPVYRRRNTVATIDKNGATIDNRYIVPYNAQLLLKYQAHINVEWCNQTASIKYLFKYINKGTDRTTFCLSYHGEDGIDEITEHQDGRYISACEAVWRILKFDINYRGLIDDEKEYILAIEEASVWGTETYLRRLFCTLLVSKSMRRPEHVWENTWKHLSDDILHKQRKKYNNPDFQLSEQVRNLALLEMEKILASNNYSLKYWKSMPFPDEFVVPDIRNRFIHDEISYDKDAMNNEHSVLYSKLTDEQTGVYHKIMSVVDRGRGGVFFLYGYGGTGKTFIWKTLCSKLRGRGDIVLPIASSGFASLLLPRGRTAHSRFSIPLDVHEESFCPGLSPGTDLSELLKRTKLIIWDEAPMTNKHCFEALDRSLKDIIRSPSGQSSQMPFGGLVVVFGGDFRQILPVVQMGSRYDIVNATITSSKIWESCEVLQLTRNMRLQGGSSPSEVEEIKNFAEWLLEVGNGTLGGEYDGEADIKLPDDIIIKDAKNPIASIVESTYPSILQNMSDPKFFQERAILAPTNEMVEKINEYILSLMPGEEVEYLSSDCISMEGEVNEHEHIYSTEFLNTVRCSGLPNHSLKLKVGCMVMLLRNIDQGAELCNGTRLIVTKLGKLVVEAKMLTGKYAEEMVYIPRTIMSPTDFTKFPVEFQRRQFPLAVCFAMTINKSQGQSLANVGLYLPKPVFSHGQLYVAFSKVTTKKGLKVLAYDKDSNISDTTTNVVYREIFNKL